MKKKNQINLIIVALAFIIPFIIAFYILHFEINKEMKTSNYGKIIARINTNNYKFFIQPALTVREPTYEINKTIKLEKIWTILYFNPISNCDDTCKKDIHFLKQIHIALGKDMDRVQRAWLNPAPQKENPNMNHWINTQNYISSSYPNFIKLKINKNNFIEVLEDHAQQKRKVFLIDPLGHVILMWPSNFHGKKLLKDLKKLLKLSRIG